MHELLVQPRSYIYLDNIFSRSSTVFTGSKHVHFLQTYAVALPSFEAGEFDGSKLSCSPSLNTKGFVWHVMRMNTL